MITEQHNVEASVISEDNKEFCHTCNGISNLFMDLIGRKSAHLTPLMKNYSFLIKTICPKCNSDSIIKKQKQFEWIKNINGRRFVFYNFFSDLKTATTEAKKKSNYSKHRDKSSYYEIIQTSGSFAVYIYSSIQAELIELLLEHGALTRPKLIQLTDLPPSTLFDNLKKLMIGRHLIKCISLETHKRGRRPTLWFLDF